MTERRIVYIVDDEDSIRRSTSFMLKTSGYRVATFASGASFLKEVRHLEPGCVLLDIRMPDIDGLQVQEAMIKRGVAMPIVFLTAHGDVATAVKVMKRGAVELIEKPFEKEIVLAALEQSLPAPRRTATARSPHPGGETARRGPVDARAPGPVRAGPGAGEQGHRPRTRHLAAHGRGASRQPHGQIWRPHAVGSAQDRLCRRAGPERELTVPRRGSVGRDRPEAVGILDDQPSAAGERDHPLIAERSDRPAHRLDDEAEKIGHLLPRER